MSNVRAISGGAASDIEATLQLLADCGVPAARPRQWCLLRCAGQRTLLVADALASAGFEVWTPRQKLRRTMFPGSASARRSDIDVPILPTFVFASAEHLGEIAAAADDPAGKLPAFSIFRHAGRIPLVRGSDVAGLQEEEASAAATYQAMLEADSREEAERIRIAALRTEQQRRRAQREAERKRIAVLRGQPSTFTPGDKVSVREAPALTGKTGVVLSSDGGKARVSFGSGLAWTIDAWRLTPDDVVDCPAPSGTAA